MHSGELKDIVSQITRHIKVTKLTTVYINQDHDEGGLHPAKRLRVFRAKLDILQALKCTPDTVLVGDYVASDGVVACLAHLPPARELIVQLQTCEMLTGYAYKEEYWPMAKAPSLIPRSYGEWSFHAYDDHLSRGEMKGLLLNAPSDRTSASPLTVTCHQQYASWAEAYRERMLQPNVTVLRGDRAM